MRNEPHVTARLITGAFLVVGLPWAITDTAAQGICVVCTGPDASYRCMPASGPAVTGDTRLNLLCITEIAKSGKHESCGVNRQQTTCDAQARTATIAASPPPDKEQAAVVPEEPGKAKSDKGPPDTVADLAKRTADSSKSQLQKATEAVGDATKKAGGAVGSAAKKSWRCLSSLFQEC